MHAQAMNSEQLYWTQWSKDHFSSDLDHILLIQSFSYLGNLPND